MRKLDFNCYVKPLYPGNLGFTPIRINNKKAPLDYGWNTNPPLLDFDENQLYGMMPPPDILVIDVDVKNGKQGTDSWSRLLRDCLSPEDLTDPTKYPSLPNVTTPSGGFHFYIYLGGQDHRDIPKNHPNYPGIDFITHGKSQVVAGNQTLENGRYSITNYMIYSPFTTFVPLLTKPREVTNKYLEPTATTAFTRDQIEGLLHYIPCDDYDVWHKVAWCLIGSPLSREEAKEIWFRWSSASPKFDEHQATMKWQEHLERYGANNNPLTVASLPYYARFYSPDHHGEINNIIYSCDDLDSLFISVQSVTSSVCFFNLKTRSWCKAEMVKCLLKKLMVKKGGERGKKMASLQDLIDDGVIKTPIDIVYAPDKPSPLYTDHAGRLLLNIYSIDSLPPALPYSVPLTGGLAHFIQHVHQIFGTYASDFLDYIAYLAQNPGHKIRYCLVLEGGKGTGKGLILEAIKNHVLGRSNCRVVTTTQLCSEYNGWAFDRQLIHIDELLINGKDSRQVMDRLKTMITESVVPRNEKYMKTTEVPCPASFIALTNHKDCLKDADNRRYHAIISPIRNKGDIKLGKYSSIEDYYNTLIDFTNQDNPEGGTLRSYFLNYSISSSFNPGERPQTSDFDKFQEQSKTADHDDFADYIELIKYIHKTDTLPKYFNLHEVCARSTEIHPDYNIPFFTEQLTPKQLKKFGRYMGYLAFSGYLYSSEINEDKAKEAIRALRRRHLQTTF